MGVLWFLVAGSMAGWLTGILVNGGGFGLLGNSFVGVTGIFVGALLFSLFGIQVGSGLAGALVVATTGSLVLVFTVRLVKKSVMLLPK